MPGFCLKSNLFMSNLLIRIFVTLNVWAFTLKEFTFFHCSLKRYNKTEKYLCENKEGYNIIWTLTT